MKIDNDTLELAIKALELGILGLLAEAKEKGQKAVDVRPKLEQKIRTFAKAIITDCNK